MARYDPPDDSGALQMSFGLVPGLSMVWQARRWLEVVLRPVRLEILGLAGEVPGSTGVFVRWGLDAQVRFRL